MTKYEIQEKTIGQYTIRTIEDSRFVSFMDKLNGNSLYIPKRLVVEMYELIGTSNTDWKHTYNTPTDKEMEE